MATLTPAQRLRVVLEALDRTLASFARPYEQTSRPATCQVIDEVREALRSAVADGRDVLAFDDFDAALDRLGEAMEDDQAHETAGVLMALLYLFRPTPIEAGHLAYILDSFYQSALATVEVIRSIEDERAAANCRAAIAAQRQIVERVAAEG